jgi:hypothetical protein
MSSISKGFKIKRVAGIGALVAIGAFLLLLFLTSLGDNRLPPYNPPYQGERAGWMILS